MIPKQLQKGQFRFIELPANSKFPPPNNWTNDETKRKKWNEISCKGNYGVCCGYGNIIIVDCDTEKIIEIGKKLPETFTVKTGRGGLQLYYICSEIKHTIRLQEQGKPVGEAGDIISFGKYAVGVNSIHPNGNKYKCIKDVEISTITKEELMYEFKDFLIKNEPEQHKQNGELINIDITKVIPPGFKTMPNGKWCVGACPNCSPDKSKGHKYNFGINLQKGYFHCWHHDKSGGAIELIALVHNIISCDELQTGVLRGEKFKQVLKMAEEQYGLKISKSKYDFKKLQQATNYLMLIEEFIKEQPVYYDNSKNWWLWNHKEYMWERVDETDLLILINDYTESPSTNAKIRGEILEAFRQVGRKNKPKEAKPYWVQFKDKIVDLENDETFEATAEYFITNPINWSLGETEDAPEIDKLFESWVGEKKIDLYEIFAFCLVPEYFIHRIICLTGSGANGKSTFLNMLNKFIGEYNITSSSLDSLCGSNRFESSKLFKKLVCFMGETNYKTIKQTEKLKDLSGQGIQSAEFKGTNGFTFVNYAKFIIATNSLPTTMDKTDGFYRRWKIIDFLNKFKKEKDVLSRVPDIEYNNLALRCLNIAKRLWKERTFLNDGTFEERKKDYEDRSNPVMRFIKERYERSLNEDILYADFYDSLVTYLVENGHRELTQKTVSQILNNNGFLVKIKNVKVNGKKTTARYIIGMVKLGRANNTGITDNTQLSLHSPCIEPELKSCNTCNTCNTLDTQLDIEEIKIKKSSKNTTEEKQK